MGKLPNAGGNVPMKAEKKAMFIQLRSLERSYPEILEAMKEEFGACVDRKTLQKWSKEFEVAIAELKQTHLEVLVNEWALNRQAMIEARGKALRATIEELEERDLSKVDTRDLLVDRRGQFKDTSDYIERILHPNDKKGQAQQSPTNIVIMNALAHPENPFDSSVIDIPGTDVTDREVDAEVPTAGLPE